MTEEAPAASTAALPVTKMPAKRVKKAAAAAVKPRKSAGPSVTELLTEAVSASKERSGVSLAALKKSLAAAGYDVEKNNSRIKQGLKSLVTKGTLVQTKGTGASGSFKFNKKQAETKAVPGKKKPAAAAKSQKPASATKKVKKAVGPKKSGKKPTSAAGAKRAAAKSPKRPKAAKAKRAAAKSPAKARTAKPKAKPKTPKAKVAKPKRAAAPKK